MTKSQKKAKRPGCGEELVNSGLGVIGAYGHGKGEIFVSQASGAGLTVRGSRNTQYISVRLCGAEARPHARGTWTRSPKTSAVRP